MSYLDRAQHVQEACPLSNKTGGFPFYSILARKRHCSETGSSHSYRPNDTRHHFLGIKVRPKSMSGQRSSNQTPITEEYRCICLQQLPVSCILRDTTVQ